MIGVSLPNECFRSFGDVFADLRGKFDLWEIVSEMEHDVRHVSGAMASADMKFQVHAPFSDANPASLNIRARELALDVLSETIRRSADGGAKVVTVHPGIISPMGSYAKDKVLAASVGSLKALARVAEDSGIALAVENMPTGPWAFLTTAAECKKICDETGLPLCFDIGHAHLAGQEKEFFELSGLFVNVHVHDNVGTGKDAHLTVGDGTADFAGLKRALSGYKGHVVIEGRSIESALESKNRLESLGFV